MTDANEGVSRRAFLFGSAGAAATAAAGAAAAQQEGGNGTSSGNNTTAGGAGNGSTGNASADTNASAGNASAGGNTSAGNASGGNESGGNASGGNASGGNASGGNESGGNASGGGGASAMSETVAVGPNGDLVFDPDEVEVTPGSTVTWVWESDGHNVIPSSVPEGASWEGTKGGSGKLYDTGHEYSFTFETEGTYEYVCSPHESAGMVGAVTVSADAGSSGGGGGSEGPPQVPDSAKSLGVATSFLMIATLGLSYFFLKYGGDYGAAE